MKKSHSSWFPSLPSAKSAKSRFRIGIPAPSVRGSELFLKYFSICAASHTFCAPIRSEDTNRETDIPNRPRIITDNQNGPYPAAHSTCPAVNTSESPMAATRTQKKLENRPTCPGNGHALSTYTGEDRNLNAASH